MQGTCGVVARETETGKDQTNFVMAILLLMIVDLVFLGV